MASSPITNETEEEEFLCLLFLFETLLFSDDSGTGTLKLIWCEDSGVYRQTINLHDVTGSILQITGQYESDHGDEKNKENKQTVKCS